jgi:hypothetical protein
MSTPGSRVTPLRRPPVRQSVVVRSDRPHTFGMFVATIGAWWPVTPFSAGRDRVRDVTFEPREGGRVYETWQDGTEVELTFAELGPLLTRVTVEHRGWERLTEEQLAEDCALPGGYPGGAYREGWARILGALAATIGGQQ